MTEPGFVPQDAHADISVVVVTYNSAAHIEALLDDLRAAARYVTLRVIVVDNQSRDATIERVAHHPDVILLEAGGNLGFGGGLNAGLRRVGDCDAVLFLNPDLRLDPDAPAELLAAVKEEGVGAAVPALFESDGELYLSLYHEPTPLRALGDALFGRRFRSRPGWLAGTNLDTDSYRRPHDVEWATGAALLVSLDTSRAVGAWWDDYPIYAEETDYFRRIRSAGRRVRFVPTARMTHHGGGSGSSPGLLALMAVNGVRYIGRYHGRAYTAAYRAVAVVSAALRANRPDFRYCFAVLCNRARWNELPAISKPDHA